ncbi:SDR family NAD(P)-dependent oxidoreductase [Sabulicella rubraurantiaca]|uniref:SDR family NAD(P)-dependent oxidoreductase n=1 Tax=Sabulicella rubraurantiaca TaxID=2811429 RepID=UPI001A963077|nr:SDR family NAD(P)-dependent oxidoreductase [Sabulicella rubraurantiaca]
MAARCVLITGASRGLGAALARHLAAPGVMLRLVARDAAALEAVAAECRARGAELDTALLDVRDAAAMAGRLLAWDSGQPFTHVIAAAGVSSGTPPEGGLEAPELAARTVAVNLLGAMNTVAPLLPRLIARRSGRVVLVGSVAGFLGLPDSPAYCASKAGLWTWGEALRAKLAPDGVGVTVAAPGFFGSAMSARYAGPHPGEISAEAMARRIWRAVERGRGRVAVPAALGLLLRLLLLLPAPLADRAARLHRFTISPEAAPHPPPPYAP